MTDESQYVQDLKVSLAATMRVFPIVNDAKLAPTARAAMNTSTELALLDPSHDHYSIALTLADRLRCKLEDPDFPSAQVATTAGAFDRITKELSGLEVQRAAQGEDRFSPTARLLAAAREAGIEPVRGSRGRS